MAYVSEERLSAIGASSTTIVQEGFVWVMSRTDHTGLVRLGSSLEQPDTINNSSADGQWRLDYFARVDDRQQAHAAASEFLAPFRRDRHLYETDAVVAATAIENCAVPIQFRKTSFRSAETGGSEPTISQPIGTESIEDDSGENRSVRQRAMAKLLFDAEQLLEDSELVTGPISYERAFPSPAETARTSPVNAAMAQPATSLPAAPVEPATEPADELTHRSPMNELLTSEAKANRIASGSLPATRTPPPPTPMPPRQRPATEVDSLDQTDAEVSVQAEQLQPEQENEDANPLFPRTEEVLWMDRNADKTAGAAQQDVPLKTDSTPRPEAESEARSEAQVEARLEEQNDVRVDSQSQRVSAPDDAGGDEPAEPPKPRPKTTPRPDLFDSRENDRSILMQMEHLIIKREARQNLRNIRSRIGWSTVKGIPLGALGGFLLMLALNIPDDVAFLIGFLLIGAVVGACLLGAYQATRLWGAAAHWRRIAQQP